mgnify:CR=1 FL=1
MKNECYYDDFSRKDDLAFESRAVHGALGVDPMTGAVSFPIFQTATFRHRDFGISTGYNYSRLQNPTRQELERTMAILEGGLEGFAFSSGQAANMCLFSMLEKGDHVSYGCTYTADRATRVAVISIGYADGFSRLYSGKRVVRINGREFATVGRICMDFLTVDLTGAEAETGDDVWIIGGGISASDCAKHSGTIDYEIVTALSARNERLLVR